MNFSRLLDTSTTLGTAPASVRRCVLRALTLVVFLASATAAVAAESPPNGIPLSMPRYVFKPLVEDFYPTASRIQKEQGTTKIKLCYDDRGRPIESTVKESSSFPRLDEAAKRWAEAVRIRPGVIVGRSQPGCVVVPVRFSLEKSQEPPDPNEDRLLPEVQVPPILVNPPLPPPPPPVRLIPLGAETGYRSDRHEHDQRPATVA
jgi:TonB family protein